MKNSDLAGIFLVLGLISSCEKNPTGFRAKQKIWNISTPEAQEMNRRILDSAFVQAKLKGFIDGLLVIRNGFIVAEEYYNGYDEFRPHNIMSVSKSFLSAITGIALHQGFIDSLDEKVMDYFPEYVYPDMDPRKYDITIRHLLTMRMGIRDESEDNYGAYWELYNSDNWIKKTIESTLVFNPGERMRYNTFQTHLLSAIITKSTRKSTLDFAKEVLFDPLKIDIDFWEQDPQGYYFGGNSMYFTPQEVAVLGYLYLNYGRLNGLQIIPSDWVELTLSSSTNFAHPNEWGAFKNYNYAYLWWLGQINEYPMFMGYGFGGQFVIVFPGLNLIVVSTAAFQVDADTSTIQEWAIFDIIATYILRSLDNQAIDKNK
jgi:CubicO group peptidase (beta-lactamase class C family)